MKKKGKVCLVGAGPGDEGLLTIKGKRCIENADVIIYDYLANKNLVNFAKKASEIIFVGKRHSSKRLSQEQINDLIRNKAELGKNVVRIKGGDPFIFGRGGEEAEGLIASGIELEVVPGVTSLISVPAYAGIPLSHRDYTSTIAFITGHESLTKEYSKIEWNKISTGIGTLVFIMGVKNLQHIVNNLIEHGKPSNTPTAIISWGTTSRQNTITGTLKDIVEIALLENIKPPSVIVVGDVVRLRKSLNWFETKPLFGKKILITRPLIQSAEFASLLKENGAVPVIFPTIKTVPPGSFYDLDNAIKNIITYDWIIFTSINGVKYFLDRLKFVGKDIRELKGIKICAIGPKTASEFKRFGIKIDLIPEEYKAEGVIESLLKENIKNKKVLLPRAAVAREILPEQLKKFGVNVDVVDAYQTVRVDERKDEIREMLINKEIDVVSYTSSSTVTNFVKLYSKKELKLLFKYLKIAAIGPITAKTLESFDVKPHIVAEQYTVEGLTNAIVEYFKN